MLKGQQFLNTVKHDQSVASQISHSTKSHHPQTIYNNIDKQFVQSIQSRKNANVQYFQKMKALHMDQLDMGLQQYYKSKQVTEVQKQNERKDYRERVNGVLGEIQKNIMNRSRLFQSQLIKQQEKNRRFIDDNAIKERKISNHVNVNYDKDLFYHESDRYQQYQNVEHDLTLKMRQMQKKEHDRKIEEEKYHKQLQTQQRMKFQKNLEYQRYLDEQQRLKNQQKYQIDLRRLVEEKKEGNRKKPQLPIDHRRHNPITNPIEYHIENPYILKRLERYQ